MLSLGNRSLPRPSSRRTHGSWTRSRLLPPAPLHISVPMPAIKMVRDLGGELPLVLKRFGGSLGFGCNQESFSVCVREIMATSELDRSAVDRDLYYALKLDEVENFACVQSVLRKCPECASLPVYALFPVNFQGQFEEWVRQQPTQRGADGSVAVTLRVSHIAPVGFEVVNPGAAQ